MKKLVMIAAVMLFTKLSIAQTEKGDQTVGFSIGINYNGSHQNIVDSYSNSNVANDSRQGSFSVAPSYSLFIARGLDLGISVSYSNYNLTENYSPDQYYSDLGLHQRDYAGSLFLRKYFLYDNKIGFRFGPYLSYAHEFAGTYYRPGNNTPDNTSTTEAYSGGFQLDFVYYPSKHLSFAAGLGNLSYQHDLFRGMPNTGTENNFNLAFVNNDLSIGVFYTFN